MAHHLLTYSLSEQPDSLSLHDRVQIALAIAGETLLKSLLCDCLPPLAQLHRIGSVSTSIGIPLQSHTAADGIIEYESIHCQLIDASEDLKRIIAAYAERYGNHRGYLDLTRCEAETRTLGQGIPLAQAIALLIQAGFSHAQVQSILHLPYDAWYKSWWYTTDGEGKFSVPFLRLIRTFRYADGNHTLQYKDFFAQDKPTCFKSESCKVLIDIRAEPTGFRETLERINTARQQLGMAQALLICDRITDLEARAFISQNISVYATTELALPAQANCEICANSQCPLNGNHDSPVLTCHRFCLDAQFD